MDELARPGSATVPEAARRCPFVDADLHQHVPVRRDQFAVDDPEPDLVTTLGEIAVRYLGIPEEET